jgi:hypothetical protein
LHVDQKKAVEKFDRVWPPRGVSRPPYVKMATGNSPLGNAFPSSSPWGDKFPIPILAKAHGEAFFPIPVLAWGKIPVGDPRPALVYHHQQSILHHSHKAINMKLEYNTNYNPEIAI